MNIWPDNRFLIEVTTLVNLLCVLSSDQHIVLKERGWNTMNIYTKQTERNVLILMAVDLSCSTEADCAFT